MQSKAEDEKISAACYLILNKLQLYKSFKKIKKQIKKLDEVDPKLEESLVELLEYVKVHLPMHLETENLLLTYNFSEVVTKELRLGKMRELAYSIFDQEKTKISNYQYVKDLIMMDNQSVSQAISIWFNEVGMLNIIGILMVRTHTLTIELQPCAEGQIQHGLQGVRVVRGHCELLPQLEWWDRVDVPGLVVREVVAARTGVDELG